MDALVFKLQGKMAHFRKYYSNSTALSYHIPPVTTIKGILAGLLGYERDSYYKMFANDQCRIGIAVDYPLKKITQTMNLMKIERPSELPGKGVHTQNHTEWIVPYNIRTSIVSYTIVVTHKQEAIMQQLQEKICTLPLGYQSAGISVALGSAQCQGWISEGRKICLEEKTAGEDAVLSRFAVPIPYIQKAEPYQNTFCVKKEETITEFDENRYLTEGSKINILLSADGTLLSYVWKPGVTYWSYEGENLILLGDEKHVVGSL